MPKRRAGWPSARSRPARRRGARDARLILVAADAAENSVRRVRHFADAGQCLWCRIGADKDALGRAVGRSSCAMLAVTDIGFAEAIAKKLAEGDERFTETAEKLAVKARRAAERRREAEAHEKNVRTGKKRPAKKAAEAGEAESKRTEKRPALRVAAGAGGKRPTGAQSRGDAKKPSREERKRSAVKAAARARYADSRPVKRGKGSAKKREAVIRSHHIWRCYIGYYGEQEQGKQSGKGLRYAVEGYHCHLEGLHGGPQGSLPSAERP